MKLFIAALITLNTVVAFAAETESKCGQVADSVERSNPKTETAPSQESSTRTQGAQAQ